MPRPLFGLGNTSLDGALLLDRHQPLVPVAARGGGVVVSVLVKTCPT